MQNVNLQIWKWINKMINITYINLNLQIDLITDYKTRRKINLKVKFKFLTCFELGWTIRYVNSLYVIQISE